MAADTVLGRSGSGDIDDIQIVANHIASNAVTTAKILDANVTLAKLANIATDSLIGRDTAASGVPENILLNSTLEMDGSGNLRRAALTGDVTASAGSNTTAIGAGVIVDADINASGITTRSKLPAEIVYDDEANVMGDFDLELHDNRLISWNPARTFKYTHTAQAITADVELRYPLTTGITTLLSRNSTDTVQNKTIETDQNTIKHSTTNNAGDILRNNATKFERFARGNASEVLRVNSGATDIEYGLVGDANIGSHTSTKITITAKGQLNSAIMYEDEDNIVGAHYMEFEEIADPTAPAANKARLYFDDTDEHLKVIKNGGTIVDLEVAGGGSENTSASNVGTGEGVFKTEVGDDLRFKSLLEGTNISITANTDDLTFDVPDGSTTVKGAVELATDGETASGVAVQGNDARLANNLKSTADNNLGDHYLDIGDIAAPASPAADHGRIFFDSADEVLKIKKSGGAVVSLEGGGGSESTTVVNLGTGQGVFKALNVAEIQLRSLTATSSKISLANNTNDIGIDVAEANLALGSIGGSLVIGQIPNSLITLAKIENIPTNSLLGRDTAATGVIENILLDDTLEMDGSGNLQRAALTGDVTSSAGSNATAIANDVVSNTKLANMAGFTVKLKSTTGSGDPEDFALGTNVVLGRVAGDIVAAQLATAQVANDAIDNTKLANMAGFTVKAKATTGSGDPTDVSMAADTVLGRSGSGDIDDITIVANHISSNAVTTAKILDANVTLAKLANIATDSLIGRDTAASGVPENILLNSTLEMDGSGNLRRAALTGDITASAGSNTTAIGAGVIVDADINASGITTRTKLPSAIMYEDEDNNMGAHFLDIAEIADPSSPAANHGRLFFDDTDEHLKIKKSGGSVVDLESGAGGGEANTASNSGTAGVGVWARKTSVDLEFKNLNTTMASYVTITDDTGNDEIDIDLSSLVAKTDVANIFSQIQTSKLDNSQPIRIRRDNNTVGTGVEIPLGLEDSTGADVDYARIRSEIKVNTAGSTTGSFELQARIVGSMVTLVRTNDVGVTQVEKGLALGDVISPSQLTAQTDNWNPTDLQTASIIRVNTDANMQMLTGITAPSPESNKVLILRNISANTLLLMNQHADSTAANRFDFGGFDLPLWSKNEVILKYDITLDRWIASNPISQYIPPTKYGFYYRNEMMTTSATANVTQDGVLEFFNSGTGTATDLTAVASEIGHPGVVEMETGTTTTGASNVASRDNVIQLGSNWYWVFETVFRLPLLPDGTQTFGIDLGFYDNNEVGAPIDGIYAFVDNDSGTGSNGGWELQAENNNAVTSVATNVIPAANTWYRVKVVVYPDNTAELFIDDASIAILTSGLPTGAGRGTSFGASIFKTAGTTERVLQIDSIECIGYAPALIS